MWALRVCSCIMELILLIEKMLARNPNVSRPQALVHPVSSPTRLACFPRGLSAWLWVRGLWGVAWVPGGSGPRTLWAQMVQNQTAFLSPIWNDCSGSPSRALSGPAETYNNTKWPRAPQCQPSRCFLREERHICKVPSASCPLQTPAQVNPENMAGWVTRVHHIHTLTMVSEISVMADAVTRVTPSP